MQKKQYLCKVFLHNCQIRIHMLTHCTYGAHSQRITPTTTIRGGYSHTSPPQSCDKQPTDTYSTLSQAVPAISGCRMRVYNC